MGGTKRERRICIRFSEADLEVLDEVAKVTHADRSHALRTLVQMFGHPLPRRLRSLHADMYGEAHEGAEEFEAAVQKG